MLECLKEIETEIEGCQKCQLHKTRTNVVIANGDRHPKKIMVVGEAPGADEDAAGEPFVGKAGYLLNKLLERAGMSRDDIYITNMLKCRPPGNRDPEADELKACFAYLERQISTIQPKAIITLGRFSGCRLSLQYTAMGDLAKCDDLQYTPLDSQPISVLAAYHPSYILRQGKSALAKKLMEDTISKLKRAFELSR